MTVTAVILAAGVGSRLRPLTDEVPKCLVSVGTETILARMLRLLVSAGASRVVVSTGYREETVRAALASAPVPVRFVYNRDYATTQNVVSLHRALGEVSDGEVIKLDGDVVFAPAVLQRLLSVPLASTEAVVALDQLTTLGAEEMKVEAHGGTARRFGKGIDPRGCAGESIGIERFGQDARVALTGAIARAVAAGRTDVYYEDVYNDLLAEGMVMHCAPVGDLPWTEVDDVADLARARALVAAGL